MIHGKETIITYYASEIEKHRLEMEIFKLESIRTKEVIGRYLKNENLEILDVGGGAGYYAFWLHEQEHQVTLLDLAPRNIELAKEYASVHDTSLKAYAIADATDLVYPDNAFDLVLQLGPLYHLIDRAERIKALKESARVLRPGGVMIAAVISRYASLIDGFLRDLVADDPFFEILKKDLRTGVHLNETTNPEYFTTAYFHTLRELKEEIIESGLSLEKVIGVEGFGWAVKDFQEKSNDPTYMVKFLEILRLVESNEDLVAMSPHILAVALKK